MVSAKLVFFLACVVALATALPKKEQMPGGITQLSGEGLQEAQDVLQTSLNELTAGEGPNYTISKVISATRQMVSGVLYTYKVNLIDGNSAVKHCTVSIWSQPWLAQGTQVTFECQGEEKVVANY